MKMHRGVISLVFDDGYRHILNEVVPLLQRYRLPAVFALALNGENIAASEGMPVAPWTAWLPLKELGCELAAHSVSHADLTTLSPSQLDHELAAPAAALSATTLVYPGGAYNEAVRRAAAKYYSAARTCDHGLEHTRPRDPLALKTVNFTRRNFSVLRANLWALSACGANRWLIETYHHVAERELPTPYYIKLADFEQHLKFITRLPVQVTTIYAHLHHQEER